jgi:hypothetical protein
MGKDSRGAAKAERAWLRREAERPSAQGQGRVRSHAGHWKAEHRKINLIGGEGVGGLLIGDRGSHHGDPAPREPDPKKFSAKNNLHNSSLTRIRPCLGGRRCPQKRLMALLTLASPGAWPYLGW